MFHTHGLRGKAYQKVYDELLSVQQGKCAICGARPGERGFGGKGYIARRLVLDHCHTTGQVRGLLCVGCNTHLGEYEYGKKKRWNDCYAAYLEERMKNV